MSVHIPKQIEASEPDMDLRCLFKLVYISNLQDRRSTLIYMADPELTMQERVEKAKEWCNRRSYRFAYLEPAIQQL